MRRRFRWRRVAKWTGLFFTLALFASLVVSGKYFLVGGTHLGFVFVFYYVVNGRVYVDWSTIEDGAKWSWPSIYADDYLFGMQEFDFAGAFDVKRWYLDQGYFESSLPPIVAGALLVTLVLWCLDRRRLHPSGACKHCGYNLTGNTSGICPECGTKSPDHQI